MSLLFDLRCWIVYSVLATTNSSKTHLHLTVWWCVIFLSLFHFSTLRLRLSNKIFINLFSLDNLKRATLPSHPGLPPSQSKLHEKLYHRHRVRTLACIDVVINWFYAIRDRMTNAVLAGESRALWTLIKYVREIVQNKTQWRKNQWTIIQWKIHLTWRF